MADTQLYDILGISKNASDSEIKKVYKKLAKEYHPDRNPAAGDKFKEISFAYEVLSDPQKKSVYDRYGLKALQEGGFPPTDFGFDLHSHLFGDGGLFDIPGMSSEGFKKKRRGQNTILPLKVTLEDLYNGKVTELKIPKYVICSTCKGKGGKAGAVQTCPGCKGSGHRVFVRRLTEEFSQNILNRCSDCDGMGEIFKDKDKCVKCKGKKVVEEVKILEVPIDKGMKENQKITFKGEGDQEPDVEPGDIVIFIQEEPHDVFEHNGNSLVMTQTISLTEALCGFQLVIKHLDGRDLVIRHPAGEVIQPGAIKTIENEGMPIFKNPFERGHLLIKFEIQFPDSYFTDEASLKKIESLLPPRTPAVIPSGENVEEVEMHDLDPNERSISDSGRGEAYASDEDDQPNVGMQCAHQ